MENNTQIDPKVLSIVKALAYTENGGKPDLSNLKSGKTGEEKSIFQFKPDTWDMYSKQATGQENLPLTPENEMGVVYAKVHDWVKRGYSPEQIASMWNAGEQRPDAYKYLKGTNKKYGIAYDTPAYAKKVASYVSKFEKESNQTTPDNPGVQPSQQLAPISSGQTSPGIMYSQNPTPQTQGGLLTPPMKQERQV